MMHTVVRHLVPRQLIETYTQDVSMNHTSPDSPLDNIKSINNPWIIAMFALTLVSFILVHLSVRYTLGVVTILAMVETPRTTYLVADEKAADSDPEVLVVKETPVTAKIRRTVRHLISRGGAKARWRGASVAVVYSMAYYILNNIFTSFNNGAVYHSASFITFATHMLCGVGADLVLARLGMTWTHVVISEPSSQSWFRRVPSARTWKKVALPTAVRAICWQLTGQLPAALFFAMRFDNPSEFHGKAPHVPLLKLFGIAVIALMTFVGLYIPSEVTLTRVQASLLPDSDETIVNVDRTFNGKVVPEILGGSGCVGFMDAWKSFDPPARIRLLKLYAKIVIITIALNVFFAIVLAGEYMLMLQYATHDKPNADGLSMTLSSN